MNMERTADYARLVERDRVHRDVYCDPKVFADEMARIHGRAWVYVGHESQVPQARVIAQIPEPKRHLLFY